MTDSTAAYIQLEKYIAAYWPHAILRLPDLGALSSVWLSPASQEVDPDSGDITFATTLLFEQALSVDLPLVDGLSILFGSADLTLEIPISGSVTNLVDPNLFDISLIIGPLPIQVSFRSDLLIPAELDVSQAPPVYIPKEGEILTIQIDGVTVSANLAGQLGLEFAAALTLQPVFIGQTGMVVEAGGVSLHLSDAASPPPGKDASWRGVFLENTLIHLPEGLAGLLPAGIALQDASIGLGGFSGSVLLDLEEDDGVTGYDESKAKDLFGFGFTLQKIELGFEQNALVASSIVGFLRVPFFDEVLKVELGLTNDGGFTFGVASENGLFELTLENIISIEVSGFEFFTEADETYFKLTGMITPLLGGLDWPTFGVNGLVIYTDGRIAVEGGWIDLSEQKAFDLYGFLLEISQIGFGSEPDGRRWVGFSGGLHLIDLLPAGASVEGLRVIWDPFDSLLPELRLDGAGFALTIPEVFSLAGSASMEDEDGQHVFNGSASLELLPLGIQLDASLKIGHDSVEDYNFLFVYLSLELPIGIPLWATGAAIYGFSGLNGMNVYPAVKGSDWYGWYSRPPGAMDVTNAEKWQGELGGLAFGAGMVLGTLFDAGHVVSTKALFALILPGPVILFIGKANFLQVPPETSDPSSEGLFDMLAVLDARSGFMQINIDAGWSASNLMEISASAEAYFDFANLSNWHFYLGQAKPDEKRIRASVISLFSADSYLMIDKDGILTGFGVSWGQDWKFGPVKVIMRSSIEAGANISWSPAQLGGRLALAGNFEISVAGFGLGLGLQAILSGKAPTLYWVRGELILTVKLPFPIKDLEEEIVLEWKESRDPPSEDPYKMTGLEHLKVDETWILEEAAGGLDPEDTGYSPGPVVPLDARPSIVFDRSMKDETSGVDLLSANIYTGGTLVGEHVFDYVVKEITLEKWSKAGGTAWEPVEDLYGAWMAIEDGNGEPAASKLQLWTKSPFEFTRQSSRTYRDAFLANHLTWPCGEVPAPVETCIDWEGDRLDTSYGPVFERGGLGFIRSRYGSVVGQHLPQCGTQKALEIRDGETLWIVFPVPVRQVEVCYGGIFVSASAYSLGVRVERIQAPSNGVRFTATSIDSVELNRSDNVLLARICWVTEAEGGLADSAQEHIDRTLAALAHWSSDDEILEPEMWYRLTVNLETVRTHQGQEFKTAYDHTAYFQTAGPPGLTPAWGLPDETGAAGETGALSEKAYPEGGQLTDLHAYVQWAIPSDGARPVYRAYDLGAEFNETYVEQMYGADMRIRILDANGQPVRDEHGLEISYLNQWGRVPTSELSETEQPYLNRIEDCLTLPEVGLPANQTFTASAGVLLSEDFTGDLEQWTDANQPDGDPSKHWIAAAGILTYTGEVVPVLGALLVAGQEEWSDYAVEVELSDQGEDVGIVFRHNPGDEQTFYRLRLNATGRHLERLSGAALTVLWEDAVAYHPGDVERLAVQCRGSRLRGQVDHELLFDLQDDAAFLTGKVGIYTNSEAAFDSFLVREWPSGVLAPQTLHAAELQASFVLFQGGLAGGWIDAGASWNELTRTRNHIAAIGRPDWDNYRLEVNLASLPNQAGAIVRFTARPDNTFSCYRFLINPGSSTLRLARLEGTYSGSTYELGNEDKTVLWSCVGAQCGIDFALDEHNLALICDGAFLVVELDGQEVARVEDPDGLATGQSGLYYEGTAPPEFSDFIIRSAPQKPVLQWSFITSQYEGLVEQIDTFSGSLGIEEVSGIDAQQLGDAVGAAQAAVDQANDTLTAARQDLENAGADDLSSARLAAQQASAARDTESAHHFDGLYALFFGSRYRALPLVVQLSTIVEGPSRFALLLESPQPLDWSRLILRVSKWRPAANRFADLRDLLVVWNEDGTRAFLLLTGRADWSNGEYRVHFDYTLNLGMEAPVLRRSGSTLPEVAAIFFSIS